MIFPAITVDEVNRAAVTLDGAAGKSINVAKVLRALGEEVTAAGFMGTGRGAEIRRLLHASGVLCDFVNVTTPTRQCITVIDRTAQTVTELVEESQAVRSGAYRKLLSKLRRQLPPCQALVLSGSLTPNGPVDFYQRCCSIARQEGKLTIVDARGAPLERALQARPGLVKPNRAEVAATVRRELNSVRALRHAMRELHERGAERVVVTAGREPVLAFDGNAFWRIVPPVLKPINPIGSGDSFTAALVSRLIKGDSLGEACRWGAAAGAANALTPMPGELDVKTLRHLLRKTACSVI